MMRTISRALALALAATALLAASAWANSCSTHTVSARNNSQNKLYVHAFNNNDSSYVVPVSQFLLEPGTSKNLTCNTCNSCNMAIGGRVGDSDAPSTNIRKLGATSKCLNVSSYDGSSVFYAVVGPC